MKQGQAAGLGALVIFLVVVAGFCLYLLQPALETIRLNAVNDPDNQSSPILMLVLYGLHPILWGAWLLASIGAIIGVSRAG